MEDKMPEPTPEIVEAAKALQKTTAPVEGATEPDAYGWGV